MKRSQATDKNEEFSIGKVEPRQIIDEVHESYLDYAMSVIVQRALPDVRDGLKPVQRRILYAMWDLGLKASAKFRKSATVVGEVLGKYHPHGDQAVYDALVRMAQDFSMRYPLVSGQGNFGSMDGDSAAAMRYTEVKLAHLAEESLFDIDKETIPFIDNYDGSHKEPSVLPAKVPNLLLNGTLGIAVGMATSIPPHNLKEICSAIVALIENPDATIDDLLEHVKGPDFPTGGIIYNWNDIRQAYSTGRGGIIVRGKADIEEEKGNYTIIISEIPYQVNKATLIEKIAMLVKEKKIEGIKDLRDESDQDGVRVVVELKKDAYPQKILNQLFKFTQLQETFHLNTLALIDGLQPRVLTLKMILEEYVKHRQVIVRKRSEYDLKKAKERAHILEGLSIALIHIDAIIKTIKQSEDRDDAKNNLIKKFKLSDLQSIAILEMRLAQLANLERIKVEQELEEKKKLIAELEAMLNSPKKILGVIRDEVEDLSKRYGDERRTTLVKGALGEFSQEDLIPNEKTIIMLTRDGYLKRIPPDTFKTQSRGGKGVIGLTTKEEDSVEFLLSTTTHSDLLFFTTKGKVFQLKAYDVPVASRVAKGQSVANFLQTAQGESISALLPLDTLVSQKYLVMVTNNGVIKKVAIEDLAKVRRSGLIAITLHDDDELKWVKPTTGKDEMMLVSRMGQAIHFKEELVRAMGRGAAGVKGMELEKDDKIVGMEVIRSGVQAHALVVSENGYAKRTSIKEYKIQGRGGKGIKTMEVTKKTGELVGMIVLDVQGKEEGPADLLVISSGGQVIRLPIKSISVLGRATQGVRVMRFKEENDKVSSITVI